MISSVVVTYQIKPEARAEHVRLIEAVFAQLSAEQPGTVDYRVVCLDDGISFVHSSTSDTPDGASPLPAFSAFQEFNRDIGARVATPPHVSPASLIGSYQPATPLVPSPDASH